MSEVEDRLKLLLDDVAAGVATDPVAPAELVERVRRRRRRRAGVVSGAVVVLLLGLTAGLFASTSDRRPNHEVIAGPVGVEMVLGDPGPAELLVDQLPPSPLSPREDTTAVWTGREMIVWGGTSNGTVTADGAAYDPEAGTWRTIAGSPLASRTRHMAVWTGDEMVVWGGSTRTSGVGDLLDGAAYDPATDTWRTIADAPAGSEQISAATAEVAGRVVFAGGGSPSGDGAAPLLVYDPVTDAWTSHRPPGSVESLVAHRGGAVLGHVDLADRTELSLTTFDPATGSMRALPPFPRRGEDDMVDVVGIAPVDGGLVGAVTWSAGGHPRTVVAALPDRADRWVVIDELSADDFAPGSRVDLVYAPGPTYWTGEWLFGREWLPTAFAPGNGRVAELDRSVEVPCGAAGVTVWTGDEVLQWGGQNCRREGPSGQVDSGVSIRIRPTG